MASNNKTNFTELNSEKEIIPQNQIFRKEFSSQEEFDVATEFKNTQYHFFYCTFDNINFTDKSTINHLTDCEFRNCKFDNFSSENLEAIDSKFHNCTFQRCTLHDGNFVSTKFFDCYFYETELNNSNFTFAQIRHTSFNRETDFSAVKFYAAEMNSVYFNSCIVNKPVEGLDKNNITMDGATHQEVEVNRSIILDKLKIEPLKELSATQAEINLAAEYEAIHNIPEADKVTQISKNINIVKGNITEPIFTKRLNEALLEKSITKEQLNESAYQQQHLDKLQAIAEYEQKLNVSPKERIVEMNYTTAHWQPKDNISPDQAEAIYDYITDNQRIGFEKSNEIRQSVGQFPLTTDEYYSNIKYMAYVERFNFGDENSINIKAIQSALNEVPTEYVLFRMGEEQQNLFADYYETSLDFAENAEVNLSATEQQLHDFIINIRENNLSLTNDSPVTDQLSIDNILFDNDNYMHFSVDTDGYRLPGYFRVFDPANGTDMEIVSIDNWDRHPIISEQWDSLTQQCRSASLEKYRELTGQDFSLSNETLNSSIQPEIAKATELPKIDIENKPLSKEEFDKLTSEIKDIASTYQSDPELLTDYLAFKAQFYQYSPTNTMLIHLQNPHATFVGSYTFWKNKGYGIKKGQHHIKISRPIETSRFPKEINGKTVWTDIKYASSEEKAKIAEGKLEIKKTTKFIPHQVFDISQTTCPVEDYPKFYNMGHPDMEQYQLYECVKQYAKECGFTVTEEDLSSISLHGYYSKTDDSIHINSLLEDSKRLETMCHELAHGVLHKTTSQPVEISEFEAECFGTMLKRKMGFPVSKESKRYINQYFTKSKLLENSKFDIDKTLNRLSKTFNHVSKGIEATMSDMGFSPKREIAQNLSQAKSNAINPIKISENFIQALS